METKEQPHLLFVCHECDALQKVASFTPGEMVDCTCCGSRLFQYRVNMVDKLFALSITLIILFVIANIYPIMTLDIAGIERKTTLTGAALLFIEQGWIGLAVTMWVSSVFIPGFIISGLFYVSLSLRFKFHWRYSKKTLAWVGQLLPWGMMDVLLLGVLVTLVKLVDLANVLLGEGFYAFILLIFVYATTISLLEMRLLWELMDKEDKLGAS